MAYVNYRNIIWMGVKIMLDFIKDVMIGFSFGMSLWFTYHMFKFHSRRKSGGKRK